MSSASAPSVPAASPDSNRWPPQVRFILGNEAAERFSYYGMKGILALYITNILLKTKDDATAIIHLFGFANYFMPLVGAWVSDRFWGRYHTILWISLSYCVGHGVMAMSDLMGTVDGKVACLYVGLALIAFGAGGIKPCVSAFMGDQFRPDQAHLLQKAYAAFYWSINLGSTASFLIIPEIKDRVGYGWAFGVPGIAMGLATYFFWLGTKQYVRVPPSSKTKTAGFFRVFIHALGNQRLKQRGQNFWDVTRGYFTDAEVDAARSFLPILGIFAFIPIFWALFDQTFSTWVLQGEKMVPCVASFKWIGLDWTYTINAEKMLTANPVLVMIFLPIMTLYVYPALGRFATPLRRMSYGMFLSAASFVIVAWLQVQIDAGAKMSILWQIFPYVVLTIAEVLVSTTGLEFAFREAAPSMKSTIMGFWNLTVALGNLLVPLVTALASRVMGGGSEVSISPKVFMFYAQLTFIAAIIFSIICAFYKYRDKSAAEGR